MSVVSPPASSILARMDPDRSYEAEDLRAFVPGASPERFREIMHELWVSRQVERVGYSGWRRQRSAAGESSAAVSGDVQIVKPEELFDHDAFADFFK
jgi:hypothetical protein